MKCATCKKEMECGAYAIKEERGKMRRDGSLVIRRSKIFCSKECLKRFYPLDKTKKSYSVDSMKRPYIN